MPVVRTHHTVFRVETELPSTARLDLYHKIALEDVHFRQRAATQRTLPASVPVIPAKPVKKKKAPNAFILFRSHAIANKLLPSSVTHQNDVSRMVAELWRAQDDVTRDRFFKLAEEEKKRFQEDDGNSTRAKKVSGKRADRRAQRTVKQVRMQMPTPPTSPESLIPASPALPVVSDPSDWSATPLQYPVQSELQTSEEAYLPSPPVEVSRSSFHTEGAEFIEPACTVTEPIELPDDFEWAASAPTTSLSLIVPSTDDFESLVADDVFDPLRYTGIFDDLNMLPSTSEYDFLSPLGKEWASLFPFSFFRSLPLTQV